MIIIYFPLLKRNILITLLPTVTTLYKIYDTDTWNIYNITYYIILTH